MKRYSALLIWFMLFSGCLASSTQEVAAYINFVGNDTLGKLSIKWECLNGEGSFDPEGKSYQLGAIVHQAANEKSFRTQNWDKRPFSRSIGVSIVPYIRDVSTDRRLYLVPNVPEPFNSYYLACLPKHEHFITKNPSLFPRILLTSYLADENDAQKKKAIQNELIKFLQQRTNDFADFYPGDGETAIPLTFTDDQGTYKALIHEQPVNNLFSLVKLVLEKKTVAFLDGWREGKGGEVEVEVPKWGIKFTYHPEATLFVAASAGQAVLPQDSMEPTPGSEPESLSSEISSEPELISPELDAAAEAESPTETVSEQGMPQGEMSAQEPELAQKEAGEVQKPQEQTDLQMGDAPKVSESVTVEIVLPEAFATITQGVSERIKLAHCESAKPVVNNPRTYTIVCPHYAPLDMVQISGFQKIPVSFESGKNTQRIELRAEELIAALQVSLSEDAGVPYIYDEKSISSPGETLVDFPLDMLDSDVKISPQRPEYAACTISHTFSLQEILENDFSVRLSVPCKKNTIFWPESLSAPTVKPTECVGLFMGQQAERQLTCTRRKSSSLTLSWDNKQTITIPEMVLNAQEEYYLKAEEVKQLRVEVELVLPEQLAQFSLKPSDMTLGPQCHMLTGPSSENSHVYTTSCETGAALTTLHIPGFEEISLRPKVQPDKVIIQVEAHDVLAKYSLSLENAPDLFYTYNATTLSADTPTDILVSLDQFSSYIEITPKDSQFSACTINMPLTWHDIFDKKTATLKSPCRTHAISWQKHWGEPLNNGASNCIKLEAAQDRASWMCTHLADKIVSFSWGDGWEPISIRPEQWDPQGIYRVSLQEFVPFWPVKTDDPWLKEAGAFLDFLSMPCEAGPGYEPFQVLYCQDNECRQFLSVDISWTQQATEQLPGPKTAGWPEEAPLPEKAKLRLKKTSPNPSHASYLAIPWSLSERLRKSLKELYGEIPLQTLPVQIISEDVPYNARSKFMFFDTVEACENADLQSSSLKFHVYTKSAIENSTASPCSQALIVQGTKRLTPCIPGKSNGERVVFTMKSNKIPGKRLVVMVANSKDLSEAGRGVAIREALIDWLLEMKQLNISLPFNVFVVEDNNEVKEVLRGEDLSSLAASSDNEQTESIVGLIRTSLPFDADGFQPLRNISTVGEMTADEQLGQVLCFTDSRFLPDSLNDALVGPLLGWKIDGVGVTVVTNGACEQWSYRDLVSCRSLGMNPDKAQIKALFNQLHVQ